MKILNKETGEWVKHKFDPIEDQFKIETSHIKNCWNDLEKSFYTLDYLTITRDVVNAPLNNSGDNLSCQDVSESITV